MSQKKEFGKIYDKHVEEIYRFVYLKVSSRETAEDITSETFRKGWKRFKKSPMDNPRAYLYKVARNLVIDHYRTQKEHVSPEDIQLKEESNLEESLSLDDDLQEVKEAMESLKDNYQNIIILRYLEELSISETAKILDKSEGAIRVTTHRALEALKEELGVEED